MQEQPIKGNISLYDPSMEPWDQGQSKFLFMLNVEIDLLSYIVRQNCHVKVSSLQYFLLH